MISDGRTDPLLEMCGRKKDWGKKEKRNGKKKKEKIRGEKWVKKKKKQMGKKRKKKWKKWKSIITIIRIFSNKIMSFLFKVKDKLDDHLKTLYLKKLRYDEACFYCPR